MSFRELQTNDQASTSCSYTFTLHFRASGVLSAEDPYGDVRIQFTFHFHVIYFPFELSLFWNSENSVRLPHWTGVFLTLVYLKGNVDRPKN